MALFCWGYTLPDYVTIMPLAARIIEAYGFLIPFAIRVPGQGGDIEAR